MGDLAKKVRAVLFAEPIRMILGPDMEMGAGSGDLVGFLHQLFWKLVGDSPMGNLNSGFRPPLRKGG